MYLITLEALSKSLGDDARPSDSKMLMKAITVNFLFWFMYALVAYETSPGLKIFETERTLGLSLNAPKHLKDACLSSSAEALLSSNFFAPLVMMLRHEGRPVASLPTNWCQCPYSLGIPSGCLLIDPSGTNSSPIHS